MLQFHQKIKKHFCKFFLIFILPMVLIIQCDGGCSSDEMPGWLICLINAYFCENYGQFCGIGPCGDPEKHCRDNPDYPGCQQGNPPECPAGCTFGFCVDGELVVSDSNRCADITYGPYGQKCTDCGPPTYLQVGYTALPQDTLPANVVRVTPENGKILEEWEKIEIQFNESMDPASVTFTENMALEASTDYSFSRSDDELIFNDTLTISPITTWNSGFRNLTVNLSDASLNETTVPLSYRVFTAGEARVPDFTTCVNVSCGQRWFLPYGVLFEANGGVLPYIWRATLPSNPAPPDPIWGYLYIQNNPPPHDANLFSYSGFFSGGPANWLGTYFFNVCVTDLMDSEKCHQISWGSGI